MQYNTISMWRSRAFHKPLTLKSRPTRWIRVLLVTIGKKGILHCHSGAVTENESRKVERQGPGLRGITCQEKEFGYAF